MIMTRCDHIDPGIPSINHPERPVVSAWRCAKDAGHEGSHAPVAVCQKTAMVRTRPWPCVLAIGHQGACEPPVESAWLTRPLRECDREELIAAASLAFTDATLTKREAQETVRRGMAWENRIIQLAGYVLDNIRSPHGNRHEPGCWRRHPHCLAFAILGSGGLESAERDIRNLRAEQRAGGTATP